MTLSQKAMEKLGQLYAPLANAAVKMSEIAAQKGIQFTITQGFRSVDEQNKLYAQGRTAPGPIVTKARGGKSWHNFGMSFDIVLLKPDGNANWDDDDPQWAQLGTIGTQCGLEWGGHWVGFKDLPHFQWPTKMTLAEAYTIFQAAGVAGVWAAVDNEGP